MIDWLTVRIPLYHRAIPQGSRLMIDVDGSIMSETRLPRMLDDGESEEGSYSPRVMVQSDYGCAHDDILPTLSESRLRDSNPLARCLVLSGNLAKYLQGHNIFGVEDIRLMLLLTVNKISTMIGLSRVQRKRLIATIWAGRYEVTRIDITHMYDLGTDAAVNRYIRMLQFCCDGRGNRAELCRNTFYVGKHSGLWSIKFYNKLNELSAPGRMHRLPLALSQSGLVDFASGQLRVELVLRKQQLVRLGLNDKPMQLQASIDEVYQAHMDKIRIKHQQVDSLDVSTLPNHYQRTYLMWRAGHNVKDVMPHNTYYRHVRYFMGLGINLKLPPVANDERDYDVKPISWLMSKRVTEIPEHLKPYMLAPLAS